MANYKGIRPEQLAAEIHKQLKEYTDEVKEGIWDTAMKVSESAVQRLKEDSPKRHKGKNAGKYAKDWMRTLDKDGVVIHNKAPTYRLTHLLEKGHQLRCGGRKIGEVPAYPHIANVEKDCIKEYVEQVERMIKNDTA